MFSLFPSPPSYSEDLFNIFWVHTSKPLRAGAGNPGKSEGGNGRQMLRVMSEIEWAMGGKEGGGHPSRGSNQIYVCLTKLIASLRSPRRSLRRAREA